jgi:flagellar biosynthesis chaperone FliJ
MPFQFSLRALLRLRNVEERRERLRLTVLNISRGRLRNEYEETCRRGLLEFERVQNRLQGGISGAEFRLEEASLRASGQRRREMAALLEALELQVQKQIAAFAESQKKRKILESLREREYLAFQQIERRHEQQRVDDLFARRSSLQQGR